MALISLALVVQTVVVEGGIQSRVVVVQRGIQLKENVSTVNGSSKEAKGQGQPRNLKKLTMSPMTIPVL